MVHTYQISGMTCTGCQKKVEHLLSEVAGVQQVSINLEKGEATLTMDHHIPTTTLQNAFQNYPKYQLSKATNSRPTELYTNTPEPSREWLETYKPILLIFLYLTGITLAIEWYYGSFSWMRWMNHFMAGFFLVFSFFKMLDLKGFAESYRSYDILAKNWKTWGYIYPFVELGLGIAYLIVFNPLLTNLVSFIVMSVSIIGVIQSVANKKQIQCACLGAVFNLPMSTVTIIEDSLMIIMSATMLITMM